MGQTGGKGWSSNKRAVAGTVTLYMADVGVAWVWLIISAFYRKSVLKDSCHSHRVTGSLAVWSHSHRQFFDTSCDHSCISISTVCIGVTIGPLRW